MSDEEKQAVKHWLASVSIVLILQIGALIWFLAKVDSRIANIEGMSAKVETLWEFYIATRGEHK